jgi:hypothetical protein
VKADGDIFTKRGDSPFAVQRKPEHIQRSLWRRISDSDAIVTIQKFFPHREIAIFSAPELIRGRGAVHCVTSQQSVIECPEDEYMLA